MNIITQNPFRVLGLTGNATEKELQKQIGIIKRYAEVGKSKSFDYDFEFIGDFTRSAEEIQEASNRIEQAHKKFLYSLFWFVKNTQFDEIAFNNLKEKEIEKAIEIWNKTLKEEITTKNYSSYLNLSTLYIALSTIEKQIDLQKLQTGISLKGNLIHSESLKDLSKLVTGNGVASDPVDISKKFVDEVIELLNPYLNKNYGISTNDLISLFNTFPSNIQKYISSKFTEVPISAIENKIEKTTRKRKDNPQNADKYAEELYKSSKQDITLLKNLMGSSNVQFRMLSDKVANEILQCSVDYFNDRQENDIDDNFETNLNTAMKLVKLADSVAISDQVKERAKENLNTLLEMKDRAIYQAIDFLQSVKDAYKTNEAQIRQEVRRLEATDIEIKLGYKSINHAAVEENIRNSIDWNKVNQLLATVLSDSNLKQIKESDKNELKTNFLELANWLKQNSQKSNLISNIIDKYKKIPPKLPFKILSSVITNTDKDNNSLPVTKPLYKKHTRYVGLKLNVECYENNNLTFYKKYVGPDGRYSSNNKISPKGYTSSYKATINKDTKTIDLSGWGNSSSCSFAIGKHCIEVYVDDYNIHTKHFEIDLAPSEKLEIELKEAEEKLTKIKKTEYYKSEIQAANFEMSEIQKFQLFRSGTTKQTQISAQQREIHNLRQKALSEKEKLIEQQNKIIYKLKSDIQNAEY